MSSLATPAGWAHPTTTVNPANFCGYQETIDGPIPPGVRPCSDQGFKFNSSLYYKTWTINSHGDRHGPLRIIAYGTPRNVPNRIQRYKKGWQPNTQDPGTIRDPIDGEGHSYVWDDAYGRYTYGEYLYWGFDVTGKPFHNAYFIQDASSATALSQKHWIRTPWRDLPDSYPHRPDHPGSVYRNPTDPLSSVYQGLRRNIERSLGFEISSGIAYEQPHVPLRGYQDPRSFMSLQQPSTMRESGFGTMFHYSWSSQSVWFQTFPLAPLRASEKQDTPISCTATAIQSMPIALTKERFQNVSVSLQGTIHDDLFIHSLASTTLHITRNDVASWRWTLPGRSISPEQVIVHDNHASVTVDYSVDTASLDRSSATEWRYETTATLHVLLHDQTKKTKTCRVVLRFQPSNKGTLHSSFHTVPTLQFVDSSELTPEQFAYRDASYGHDADGYSFEITDTVTSDSITFEPAIPERRTPEQHALDPQAVMVFFHQFILRNFPTTTSVRRETTIHIRQIIFDHSSEGRRTSIAVRPITIIQTPQETPCSSDPIDESGHIVAELPLDWYDVIPFPVTERWVNTPSSPTCSTNDRTNISKKTVYIDGTRIDHSLFFAQQFVFGASSVGVREVRLIYTLSSGKEQESIHYVHIHATQPRVRIAFEGKFKANRLLEARVVPTVANDPWVEAQSPLRVTSFAFGDETALYCRRDYCAANTVHKIFSHPRPGTYTLSVRAERAITDHFGKQWTIAADPLLVRYTITPDHPPAIIAHPEQQQLSRLDPLALFYNVESIDGDRIATQTIRIYYDADNDGTCETLVSTHSGAWNKPPVFSQVGQYAFVVEAREKTTEPVLHEFYDALQGTVSSIQGYFLVDNYEPSSALYIDIPQPPPPVDALYILDSSLETTETDAIRHQKVRITNAYTAAHMQANIGIFDLKTYAYSQNIAETRATGQQFPPPTLSHCIHEYCGTLTLTNVDDHPYAEQRHRTVTVNETKTETRFCAHTIIGTYNRHGYWNTQFDSGDCPSHMTYDDGQYTGILARTTTTGTSCSYTGKSQTTCTAYFIATYTGTVSWSRSILQTEWITIHQYIGTYEGLITKTVSQSLDTSFFRPHSTKTFIYITKNANNHSTVRSQLRSAHPTARWLVIAPLSIRTELEHDDFLELTGSIESLIAEGIVLVQRNTPSVPTVYRLVGESIRTFTATSDIEQDPIVANELQIVHDKDHFDHSAGYETWSGRLLSPYKQSDRWHPYTSTISLYKPGKYSLYRRVRDRPHQDERFASYGYFSSESRVDVIVHRRPIAVVTWSTTFHADSENYSLRLLDASYDWDHRQTRASSDRGIQKMAFSLYHKDTKTTMTTIPPRLPPGQYTLTYMAQDLEGAWSDPVLHSIDLPTDPDLRLSASAHPVDPAFTIANLPAGETVLFPTQTEYPYRTSVALWKGNNWIQQLTTPHRTTTATKIWSDLSWETLNTTPDGVYTLTVRGHGMDRSEQTFIKHAEQSFTIHVRTPIQLQGAIQQGSTTTSVPVLIAHQPHTLFAQTTKYAQEVMVVAFAHTQWEKKFILRNTTTLSSGFGKKTWSHALTLPSALQSGTYTFHWQARTANGNVERSTKTVVVERNQPPTAQFTHSPNSPAEGQTMYLTDQSIDPEQQKLARHWTITSPHGTSQTCTSSICTVPQLVPGQYEVRLQVTDSHDQVDEQSKTILVHDLTINASITHTPQWEARRLKWNQLYPHRHRSPMTFWSGEALQLSATATRREGIDLQSITAFLKDANDVVPLQSTDQRTFSRLWIRPIPWNTPEVYHLRFVATWKHGHTETTSIPFTIKDHANDLLQWHQRL